MNKCITIRRQPCLFSFNTISILLFILHFHKSCCLELWKCMLLNSLVRLHSFTEHKSMHAWHSLTTTSLDINLLCNDLLPSSRVWVGVCQQGLQTLALFKTKTAHFVKLYILFNTWDLKKPYSVRPHIPVQVKQGCPPSQPPPSPRGTRCYTSAVFLLTI